LRGATALPLLRKALRDLDPKVRSRAASTLHWRGQAKATAPALIAALKDRDRDVRDAAAWALGAVGAALGRSGTAGASLREALSDPDPRVRAAAAYVLPVLKSEAGASIPLLIARPKDSNVLVRMAAAIALGQFGPAARAAVPALLDALADADGISIDDFTVSSKAAQSLWTISTEARASTIDRLFALLGSADDQVRNRAGRTIGDLGAKLSPRLFQHLADPKISRAEQVEFLPDRGDDRRSVHVGHPVADGQDTSVE
jgi:HEAT repeat protein